MEEDKLKGYLKYINGEELLFDNFSLDLGIFNEQIPNFENEILQIIETSSQDTIDNYFTELAKDIIHVQERIGPTNIRSLISELNADELKKFEQRVFFIEANYFQSSNRKMKHLEMYHDPSGHSNQGFLITGHVLSNTMKTNYNFYCIEEKPDIIDEDKIELLCEFLRELFDSFITIANKYLALWHKGQVKSKLSPIHLKPIIFFEGDIDIDFVKHAATLLGEEELLQKVELRQRGSCNNLDKLWSVLTENTWETVLQKKLLIYDCDTNRENIDFGHIIRRTLPQTNNLIARGIENLFGDTFIKKASDARPQFVDFKKIVGTERGMPYERSENTINKHEKRNFCTWACEHGTPEDFKGFKIVFDLIRNVL